MQLVGQCAYRKSICLFSNLGAHYLERRWLDRKILPTLQGLDDSGRMPGHRRGSHLGTSRQ